MPSRSPKHNTRVNLSTVICSDCSFVFTNPLPSEESYNRFYTEAYADYYGGIASSLSDHTKKQIPSYIQRTLDEIEAFLPLNGAQLAEIGPGKGAFLYWAQRRCGSVLGIEPSKEFYDILVAQELPCRNMSLEQLSPEQDQFDIIVMSHVVEHFYDPNRALALCYNLLQDDGLLVLALPNILKPYRSLDHYFLRYVHPSSFSPETLKAMLQKHGFKILKLDEGGNDWRHPESLFAIAQKMDYIPASFDPLNQTADDVLRILQQYRLHWRLWIRQSWHVRYYILRGRRLAFRVARKIKRFVLKGGV